MEISYHPNIPDAERNSQIFQANYSEKCLQSPSKCGKLWSVSYHTKNCRVATIR